MKSIEEILNEIKKRIVPNKKEEIEIKKVVDKIKEKIEISIKKMKLNAEVVLGGSIAKNTWLSRPEDIDFFVLFDKKYEKNDISKICFKICKNSFKKVEVLHGSRDYFNVKFKGFKIEIIPVLKLEKPEEAKNSMDVSPFHVKFVRNEVEKRPEIADEIRLMKKFCDACNCYGAETFLHGFSGYVTELLIIHYGSFLNLIKNLENSEPKIVIDIKNFYKDKEEVMRKLSEAKKKSPIIIIDPILPNRNACASLNYETFSRFLFHLRTFIRNPSLKFFEKKVLDEKKLKKRASIRGTKILFFKVKRKKEMNENVFLAVLNRRIKQIRSRVEKEGFRVYDCGSFFKKNDIFVFFEIETLKLSKMKKHFGPPVWVGKKNFDEFIGKWKNVYVEENRLVTDRKRRYNDVKELIELLIN
jgi:tRNA nucleotidyltransferase (CCA-adding enzyme)